MRWLDPDLDPESAFAALRRDGAPSILFDGRGGHAGAWPCRLALEPRMSVTVDRPRGGGSSALRPLDALIEKRRTAGGPGGTGVLVVCPYDAFTPRSRPHDGQPSIVTFEADGVIVFREDAAPVALGPPALVARAAAALDRPPREEPGPVPVPVSGRPRTSLPRREYLAAVTRVKEHIAAGDIYQANLTQMFERPFDGDPWALYRAIAAATPAPRSAYLEYPGCALASVSPEIFVDVARGGKIETRPIKGTRARGRTPDDDARAAVELLASAKDRAELVMIVDVLRNDLGRVAEIGSVAVPELATLHSYAAVHHLVARVTAQLTEGVSPGTLLAAICPGGSITGAPKERAVELLASIEPKARGLYTGGLFWFDDDGSMSSSILIRSAVVAGGRVAIGAGGGVVADSEPEAEWMEANAKARALTRAVGFDPEEAA